MSSEPPPTPCTAPAAAAVDDSALEPQRARLSKLSLALLAGTLILIWISVWSVGIETIDRGLLSAVYIGNDAYLNFAARMIGHIGSREAIVMFTLCAGAYLMVQRDYWRASLPIVGTLIAHSAAAALRDFVGRPRPFGLDGLPDLHNPSLPPTRVVDPMTAYLLVALLLTKGGKTSHLLVAAAVAIGGSNGIVRVILGHHWPSDAVAGWAFGAAFGLAFYALSTRLPPPKPVVENRA
ncbi:MAG TPA: phosphatase PAP2 family protein [Sphingomicrobium sp.]|nr:phosphatase PAP2 family protein [Sphingomicrobium sp.]